MIARVIYGIHLGRIVTTAKSNDSPDPRSVINNSTAAFSWFQLAVESSARTYALLSNHNWLDHRGITPIIQIRRSSGGKYHDGVYTKQGIPTCLGQVPMEYVRSDPSKGHLYRCRSAGCHLMGSRRGVKYCDDEVWEDPRRNIRLLGVIRRDSEEWKALYAKRQAIERTFKSLKQSRRLERHCVRGLRQITLHSLMSVLVYQITALAHVTAGARPDMRWMVRRVA